MAVSCGDRHRSSPQYEADTKTTTKEVTNTRRIIPRMARDLISRTRTPRITALSLVGVVDPNNGKIVSKTSITAPQSFSTDVSDITVTTPTVTDFTKVVLRFTTRNATAVMADGQVIESGVTAIDASKPVTLLACRTVNNKQLEKRYTLVVQNTGLPVVRITTPEGKELADIEGDPEHESWFEGATIHIDTAEGTVDLEDTQMSIKGRGNVTWTYPKRSYALKLKSEKPVLGMHAGTRWILLANWRDRTLLRNDAAFWLSRKTNLPYTVSGEFVELEIDGEHRGNYYLCEQIRIGEGRIPIAKMDKLPSDEEKTGGFLMEIDCYYDEEHKFISPEFKLKYMFKDPDGKEGNYGAAYMYMADYIGDFERVLKTRSCMNAHEYKNYLDDDSAIWFMLINELTENRDFFQTVPGDCPLDDPRNKYGPHSTYLFKDRGGKLFMGPVWDFDYSTFVPQSSVESVNRTGWRGFDHSGYYYPFLCSDPDFVNKIKDLWDSGKEEFLELPAYIQRMAEKLSLSHQFDDALWPYIGGGQDHNGDYTLPFIDSDPDKPTAIKRMKDSFVARVGWMNDKIHGLQPIEDPGFVYESPDDWNGTTEHVGPTTSTKKVTDASR